MSDEEDRRLAQLRELIGEVPVALRDRVAGWRPLPAAVLDEPIKTTPRHRVGSRGREFALRAKANCETLIGNVAVVPFFGAWALRCEEIQFAIVLDTVYLRVDSLSDSWVDRVGTEPFRYRQNGSEIVLRGYYGVPAELVINDDEQFAELAAEAYAAARRTVATRRRARRPRL